MDDTKKMLRVIINGQSAIKEELIGEIRKVDKKVENLDRKTTEGFKKVDERMNKLGKSLAYLENDTPNNLLTLCLPQAQNLILLCSPKELLRRKGATWPFSQSFRSLIYTKELLRVKPSSNNFCF